MNRILTYELFEKSLKREIEHIEHDEFAIMTAWRSSLENAPNSVRMRDLKHRLRESGYGFAGMTGIGQELGGKHSHEPSLMVINDDMSAGFKESMMVFAKMYDQDYIIYGLKGKSHLIAVSSGKAEQDFTHVLPGKAEFSSALRGAESGANLSFHLAEGEVFEKDLSKEEVAAWEEMVMKGKAEKRETEEGTVYTTK